MVRNSRPPQQGEAGLGARDDWRMTVNPNDKEGTDQIERPDSGKGSLRHRVTRDGTMISYWCTGLASSRLVAVEDW